MPPMTFSLKDFPQAFLPLIVVVGDRREARPKTTGDLLAYSASTLDLLYLPKLRLPEDTLILSDKVFAIERPEVIRQLCSEVNILTIGSPAVNLFSRRINDYSFFRFEIEREAKALMQRQYNIIEQYKLNPLALAIYKAIVEHRAHSPSEVLRQIAGNRGMEDDRIDRLFTEISGKVRESGLQNYKELLRKYEGHALLNPVRSTGNDLDSTVIDLDHPRPHGQIISGNTDFGLVSIAKHPFVDPDDKVVIYVAGRHGPATAHGVAALARSELWKRRELGGIFEVQINTLESFSQRIQRATRAWDMNEYSAEGFSLSTLERPPEEMKIFLSTPLRWNSQENEESVIWLAKTISDILSKEFGGGHCHHPHEPDLAGEWNFVAGILRHFPVSRLIVHNITGCSPGVMFEVGSSRGLGKKSILFWDQSRTQFDQEDLPSLLRFTQVHSIKLADRLAAATHFAAFIPTAIRSETDTRPRAKSEGAKRQVFVFIKEEDLRRQVILHLTQRELVPKLADEMAADDSLAKVLEGVETSRYVIVGVTDGDADSMIVLGLARAMERRVLALLTPGSHGCSMFDGLQKTWHPDTLKETVEQAVRELTR